LKASSRDLYREVVASAAAQKAGGFVCLYSRTYTFIGDMIGGISLVAIINHTAIALEIE
jgi:hypothetical protein